MKVLLVVHYFSPHIGGMEAVALKQAKSLSDKGHDVTIATCRPTKGTPLQEYTGSYTVKRFRAYNGIENRFGVTFPVVSPLALVWFLRHIRSFDIVHIHDVFYMSSQFAGIACLLRRKAFFLTQHVAMVDHPSKLVMAIQRCMYGTFGRLLFRRAAKIVAYNANVRNHLLQYGASKRRIVMTHNGIDTAFFTPATSTQKAALCRQYALPADKPVALFVGRLVPKKGFDLVCKAAAADYLTLVVGTGRVPAALRANKHVRFFGPANAGQLRDLYQACDLFVFPATGEIFTLAMQEAMASGLPTITADDAGYASYELDRTKLALVPRTAASIRRTMRELLSSPQQLQDMAAYSRQLAEERFSWNRNYATEYAIYREQQA